MIERHLTLIGWVHTVVSVVAMLAFVPVMFARKGGRRHRAFGRVYSLAYVGVCATSLGIYSQQRFWFPHWLAIAGLVVLGIGYAAQSRCSSRRTVALERWSLESVHE